ncbi:MAG: WecB/TagA/CpsF family glycosyltransferase [Muribaculum sp.]|nr:WecB/TagA/CpsF family glycosyltransferase [Muribaculum sp.]
METYFNLNYEFDRNKVLQSVDERLHQPGSAYICVADGVILNTANRHHDYLEVVNGSMFSICDSSYVPLYLKWIYGLRYRQYCGCDIFVDIVSSRKYRMAFIGGSQTVLDGLRANVAARYNPDVADMMFYELPFCGVDDFDYPTIARMIEADRAEIVWVSLGAPKQEIFMAKLRPHLRHGVIIAVGSVFKFYSGVEVNRAPRWMVDHHMEFVHRLWSEPSKQFRRCAWIVATLPMLLAGETIRKITGKHHRQ